jgi:hypothetical protein
LEEASWRCALVSALIQLPSPLSVYQSTNHQSTIDRVGLSLRAITLSQITSEPTPCLKPLHWGEVGAHSGLGDLLADVSLQRKALVPALEAPFLGFSLVTRF